MSTREDPGRRRAKVEPGFGDPAPHLRHATGDRIRERAAGAADASSPLRTASPQEELRPTRPGKTMTARRDLSRSATAAADAVHSARAGCGRGMGNRAATASAAD